MPIPAFAEVLDKCPPLSFADFPLSRFPTFPLSRFWIFPLFHFSEGLLFFLFLQIIRPLALVPRTLSLSPPSRSVFHVATTRGSILLSSRL
jgi:hypothetical protein